MANKITNKNRNKSSVTYSTPTPYCPPRSGSEFLTKLEFKKRNLFDSTYTLSKELIFYDQFYGVIVVDKGFATRFESIPLDFRDLIVADDCFYDITDAFVIHDYLYSGNYRMSRKEADDVLYHALLTKEVPRWKAIIVCLTIRLFGKKHFKRCKNV